MGRIIAIGSGNIEDGQTIKLDEYIVKSAKVNDRKPKLLFIPTASNDALGYIETIKRVYGNLGCEVEALCLISKHYSNYEMKRLILDSDIIYVGGGNTTKMMEVWKNHKLDELLIRAYNQEIILSGLSAGAICWFIAGHCNNSVVAGESSVETYGWIKGLALMPYLVCPHYEDEKRKSFDGMMKTQGFGEETVGIALDSYTALVYENNNFFIIRSDQDYNAYLFDKNQKVKLTAIDL